MPKPNGLVTWKAFALIVSIGGLILMGCWGYGVRTSAHSHGVELRTVKVEATQGGIQEDIREIRSEQMRQSAKLDRILERLP